MVVYFNKVVFVVIVFVVYFSDDFLDDVFHSNDARSAAKLIDNNRNMNPVCLEFAQQFVNHFGLGNKIGGADERLPTEVVVLCQMRKQIFNIEYAFYIV